MGFATLLRLTPRRGILLFLRCLSKVSCIGVLHSRWRTREIENVQGNELVLYRLQAQAERRLKESERKKRLCKTHQRPSSCCWHWRKQPCSLNYTIVIVGQYILRRARDVAYSLHTQTNHHDVEFQKQILSCSWSSCSVACHARFCEWGFRIAS